MDAEPTVKLARHGKRCPGQKSRGTNTCQHYSNLVFSTAQPRRGPLYNKPLLTTAQKQTDGDGLTGHSLAPAHRRTRSWKGCKEEEGGGGDNAATIQQRKRQQLSSLSSTSFLVSSPFVLLPKLKKGITKASLDSTGGWYLIVLGGDDDRAPCPTVQDGNGSLHTRGSTVLRVFSIRGSSFLVSAYRAVTVAVASSRGS